MLLSLLHEAELFPIIEGYGRTQEFDYTNPNVDPTPNILKLGTWIHPNTKNTLVGGINLNYLSAAQIMKLRYYLPEILKDRNLRRRYWAGRRLMPDVFGEPPSKGAYRTYRSDRIQGISPGTLRTMTPKEIESLGSQEYADRLQQRRDEFEKLKKSKTPKGMDFRDKPDSELEPETDLAFQDTPPEPEQNLQPELPDSTAEKAKEKVDQQRTPDLAADIDDRLRAELEPDEADAQQSEEPEEVIDADQETEETEIEEPEDTTDDDRL